MTMNLITTAIRGTQDVLPADSSKWQYLEQTALNTAALFGFQEIRTPVFEHTELFQRSVGETTDVVQKEMYTFDDKGGRSITLRPEGTAGVMRAVLEHGLYNGALPLKVSYITSCYRYEKPQAGRLREFHQFGAECFGAAAATADAELIALASEFLDALGVQGVSLHINSIGCPTCRARYHEALKAYFEGRAADLCETCRSRLDRNPMRILDCKSPVCQGIAADAPLILDYLCDDCAAHFEQVKSCLDAADIAYTVDPRIVRGLDYYTRTVFEFVSDALGAQAVVCGGGRYDGLAEDMGGAHLPALGFAVGLERLLMVLEAQQTSFPEPPRCEVYLAAMGDAAATKCFELAQQLRGMGLSAACDLVGRGVKAQMKYADKIGARWTAVIGDDELASGNANLKNMETGEVIPVTLDGTLIPTVREHAIDRELAGLAELFGGEEDT